MYLSELFNRDNLFQTYGGWLKWAYEDATSSLIGKKAVNIESEIKEFNRKIQKHRLLLFHATSAIRHIQQMKILEKKCLQEFHNVKNQLSRGENRLIFWSPSLIDLLTKFSPILSLIRIMQNVSLKLISKKLKISLPNSMNDLIRKGRENYDLEVNIWRIIKRYWTKSGKYIKIYRDVDQHHTALITHSFLEVDPIEKILVILPDNPEEKSPLNFRYSKEIDAIRFLETHFIKFNFYIEELSKEFGFNPTPIFPSWDLDRYGSLAGKKGTIAVMIGLKGELLHFDIAPL